MQTRSLFVVTVLGAVVALTFGIRSLFWNNYNRRSLKSSTRSSLRPQRFQLLDLNGWYFIISGGCAHFELIENVSAQNVSLHRGFDLNSMQRQRLKPWGNLVILGGELCPATTNFHHTIIEHDSINTRKSKELKEETNDDTYGPKCPDFVKCGNPLRHVGFCRVSPTMNDLIIRQLKPPKHLDEKFWNNLNYLPASLPWQGQIVVIGSGLLSYTNKYGHVFTDDMHYLHGGCQDVPYKEYPSYNDTILAELTVTEYEYGLNLVHLHGDNYYHFLIEVLPRFYLSRALISQYPNIPILIRETPHLHLLEFIGIDYHSLNLQLINEETHLVRFTQAQFFPLAPRCLHTPPSLWSPLWNTIHSHFPLKMSTAYDKYYQIVYISRLNAHARRHISLEDELLSRLRDKFGLEQYETVSYKSSNSKRKIHLKILFGNETMEEVVNTMSKARLIIGPHGAGLANAIFIKTPKRAQLLEIASNQYWNPCFMYMANTLEMRHYLMRVEGSHAGLLNLTQSEMDRIVWWINRKVST